MDTIQNTHIRRILPKRVSRRKIEDVALPTPKDQSVQEYTTKFRQQAMALEISFNDHSMIMEYTVGLHAQINTELSLLKTHNITTTSVMAMTIEKKN